MSDRYEEDGAYSRDRSRSRSRDREDDEYGHGQSNARNNQPEETENFTMHVTGLKLEVLTFYFNSSAISTTTLPIATDIR